MTGAPTIRFVSLLRQNINVAFLIVGIILLSLLYPLVKDWQVYEPKQATPPFFIWVYVIVMGGMFLVTEVKDIVRADVNTPCKLMLLLFIFTAISQLLSVAIGVTWFFCATAYAYAIIRRKFYLPVGTLVLLLAYYLFQVTGLIGSVEMKDGLHTLKQQLPLLALPLAFCCWRPSSSEWRVFLAVSYRFVLVYLSCIILMCILLTQYYDQSVLSAFSFDKFYLKTPYPTLASSFSMLYWTHFTHPTYIFLGIYAIFIAVAIRQYFYREQVISTVEAIYGLVTLSCFAFIAQSRLAMLLIPLTVMIFFLLRSFLLRRKKRLFLVLFVILVGGGIVNSLLSHRFFSYGERMQMREVAMQVIQSHPLTGVRLGSMDNILQAWIETDVQLKHPHNQFLADGMQFGIIGIIFLVLFMVGLIYFAYREKRYVFLLFLLTTLLTMTIESPLVFVRGVYLLAFWFSTFAVMPIRKDDLVLKKYSKTS
ncbi:O-antigen ligase family protein [Porphyromonas loveana]|uniref:O-antigen ligase n=1 Tax=Porphyromonas loveana TaxID=1884669 RepID=A0A2U1FL03_9PORP|nr:O-antigen ligase [Porphyromonas loveana]